METISLVHVHVGTSLPRCLLDSLYQTLLINGYKTRIYVILSDNLVDEFQGSLDRFNLGYYTKDEFYFRNLVQVVPLSVLEMKCSGDHNFTQYKTLINERFGGMGSFRDGFWISTTSRFYYLATFMEMFSVDQVFHIENDIMMYESFDKLYEYISDNVNNVDKDKVNNVDKDKVNKVNRICMVEDAPGRVIPSLLFIPNVRSLVDLTQFITNRLSSSKTFINDMDILGSFENKWCLPIDPNGEIIFDGAAMGQYLGGVDYKNVLGNVDYNCLTREQQLVVYNNPTRTFVNETCTVKPDNYRFSKCKVVSDNTSVPVRIPIVCANGTIPNTKIANLHIHSKQLYQFSSVCDLAYDDIVSGDRVLSLCDFVLLTPEIHAFHKNIEKYARDIIVIKNFTNVNIELLNGYFVDFCRSSGRGYVKLFLYTHMLDHFIHWVFPGLDRSIQYVFYLHNSDHAVTDRHKELLTSDIVRHVYAQNIDTTLNLDKITLLPIGIANSMWGHGDILELYKTLSETYMFGKTGSIYVNINPRTYAYRAEVLAKIKDRGEFVLASSKPYPEYLRELASYRFCLCLRGNGIDTHRFWESLYLGVIPVILNNRTTACKNFTRFMKRLNIPFYEIMEDDLDIAFRKLDNRTFSENLYKSIISSNGSSVYNLHALKLGFYQYETSGVV